VAARTVTDDDVVAFAAGERVAHDEWGEGVVMQSSPERITVLFDDAGYRNLAPEIVEERQLLERVEEEGGAVVDDQDGSVTEEVRPASRQRRAG
jgi:hypothetical protein